MKMRIQTDKAGTISGGFDEFKIKASMSLSRSESSSVFEISAYAPTKHEAVERAIKQIDETIKYLEKGKKELGRI